MLILPIALLDQILAIQADLEAEVAVAILNSEKP